MSNIRLNAAQKEAVEHIYGPLLVLAGPGTGKTQLLSARIAHILKSTDVSARNILCLTFTESAAQNMRDRLRSIIKDDAYDVHINTYHGFGSDIIRSYPQYFEDIRLETDEDTRLERPIDELEALEVITKIVRSLPYNSPLVSARHYPKSVLSTISDLKRSLYTPSTLKDVASSNLALVEEISPSVSEHLRTVKRFPSKAEQSIELFLPILQLFENKQGLGLMAYESLGTALALAHDESSSKPLTEWKNTWLTKNDKNEYVFTDVLQHQKMIELSRIFETYIKELRSRQLYDFDDMILRTIEAIKTNNELRYTLQETYQFILLDEFQDTNAAQFELVKQLADNPVNEGEPNIFAVGDDDQAIYAFQGAHSCNILAFTKIFHNVKVVNLTENYRSHPDILHTAESVAKQIDTRLHHHLGGIDKHLTSAHPGLPAHSSVERREFLAEANEYSWVAQKVQALIVDGTSPDEIAILAPQHKYLEKIVPFLAHHKTPISYEKRENILQTPLLTALRLMTELIMACSVQDSTKMDELMPRVLSLEHFSIPIKDIWAINWSHKKAELSWAEAALENDTLAPHVLSFLALGMKAADEPLEYMLDYITGTTPVHIDAELSYTAPLKSYYFNFSKEVVGQYDELLVHLSTIREHLRSRQARVAATMTVSDFLDFIRAYELADQPLLNTHAIMQSESSIKLMTIFKAKGLEFEHVFLLSVHDDIWGKKAKGAHNMVSLPPNLAHIRYAGSTEDELKRLLFVAVTRAKHGLYITTHAQKDNGKSTEPAKYLLEHDNGDTRITSILPLHSQAVLSSDIRPLDAARNVEILWNSRHLILDGSLRALLSDRLKTYFMSPTHLNTYTDTEFGGPVEFFMRTLLKFPQAPSEDGEYGVAIHSTLEKLQNGRLSTNDLPAVLRYFESQLRSRYIHPDNAHNYIERGHYALKSYLAERHNLFTITSKVEIDFRREGVVLEDARLTGKIDRLEIDDTTKTIHIVDFKTGSPLLKWDTTAKSLKYKQQLYFYKILLEGSHTYSSYKVGSARLEFIENDAKPSIAPPLYLTLNDHDENEIRDLITTTWNSITTLDFLDNTEVH
jgi:DNA helicase II / ATP-dependent DNA helicase PcrA